MKKQHTKRKTNLLCAAFLTMTTTLAFFACGNASMGVSPKLEMSAATMDSASLGVTQGGAQDIDYAREEVKNARVPKPEAIVTEGLFSEYDLGIPGAKTDALIQLNPGAGMLRDANGHPHYLVQIGMSSSLTPATFKRAPLNLSLVIDVSGSMEGEKIGAARRAASKVLASLNDQDVLSLVTFNKDVDVEMSARRIRNDDVREDFEDEIDDIESDGGTDIDAGLREGFEQVEKNLHRKGYQNRVILITDARPNSGRHGENDFLRLCERWAAKDVGVTAIGVGANFGVDLATQISNIKGGNYRFVADGKALGELFEKDFDYLVTPLAYDMRMALEVAPGYRIKAVHGVPGWEEGDPSAEVNVATLFLSRNKGAMAVEIEPFGAEPAGKAQEALTLLKMSLAYTEVEGRQVRQTMDATLPRPEANARAEFTHPAVAMTAALAFSADAMRNACRAYHEGRRQEAAEHLNSVPEMVEEVGTRLQSNEMLGHAKLVRNLQRLVSTNARTQAPEWKQTQPQERPAKAGDAPKAKPYQPKLGKAPIRW